MELPFSGLALEAKFAGIPFSDAPLGQFAPSPLQRAIIQTSRAVGFGNGFVRNIATLAAMNVRAAPIDYDYHGLTLRFYPAPYASARHMLMTPRWSESRERAFLLEHLPADGVFLDMGCNAGFYLFYAAAMRPQARIIGFEPVPQHFGVIDYNIRANHLANTSVLNIALSDKEGEATFHTGGESIVSGSGDTFTVRTRPLLDVVREQNLARIDCVKIDVEGAEDLVLMPYFLAAEKALWPRAVIIEDSSDIWKENCVQFMCANGYHQVWRSRLNIGLVFDEAASHPSRP
ncbi:MAG: FkbM family methyltransferase [Beijerinckiaceae bacterium]